MKQTAIPEALIKDIQNEECVVFLGAGVSTESHKPYFEKKLVNILAEKCSYPSTSPLILPKVARYFCDVEDGGFKGRLIREIRNYLDLFMEYGEAHNFATMIHDIIAKIGFLKIIVTTNWDVFMERELNILPIVRDTDLVYWNDNKRQVIKLHGCISQPDTMIVTEDDYDNFVKNRLDSPISNKIKDLMTTKTFLFLGYSLKDESFQIIQERILSKMGKFSRVSYAVLPDPAKKYIKSWRKKGVIIIPSNALAFLRELHDLFIRNGIYFSDDFLSRLSYWIDRCHEVHFSIGQEDEIGFLSMMYQDGLQHSLQDLYYGIRVGKPKSYYKEQLDSFRNKLKDETKKGDTVEISYLRGRVEALKWALEAKKELKLYCSIGCEPINEKEFMNFRKCKR